MLQKSCMNSKKMRNERISKYMVQPVNASLKQEIRNSVKKEKGSLLNIHQWLM